MKRSLDAQIRKYETAIAKKVKKKKKISDEQKKKKKLEGLKKRHASLR